MIKNLKNQIQNRKLKLNLKNQWDVLELQIIFIFIEFMSTQNYNNYYLDVSQLIEGSIYTKHQTESTQINNLSSTCAFSEQKSMKKITLFHSIFNKQNQQSQQIEQEIFLPQHSQIIDINQDIKKYSQVDTKNIDYKNYYEIHDCFESEQDQLFQNTIGNLKRMLQQQCVIQDSTGEEGNIKKKYDKKELTINLKKKIQKNQYFKQIRSDKVKRYIEKREKRNWNRKTSYDCRKKVADSRLRIKGRFITRSHASILLGKNIQNLTQQQIKSLLQVHFSKEVI